MAPAARDRYELEPVSQFGIWRDEAPSPPRGNALVKRWLIGLIPAALIVILIGYIAGSHVVPQSVQDNFANVATPPPGIASVADDPTANADAIPEQPLNGASPATPANVAVASTPSDAPSANRPTEPDDSDPDAQAQAQREIAKAIRKATIRALDSGEPAQWHKDGLSGDIAVSEAEDEPAGTCRTITASMGDGDDRSQSSDHVWCQASDGSDWSPQ